MPRVRESHISRAKSLFERSLSAKRLEQVARETGLVQRERVVTAASLFWALIVTVGAHATQYISDVLRTMNRREGWTVRYKPFWNRLAKRAFARFMQSMFALLCRELVTRVLRREQDCHVAYFSEILIDDGSSFAVADGLRKVFPGRFTKIKPAAVELHTQMSVLSDQVVSVTVAPDKEAERAFLPPPEALPRRSLSLRDRGYIDVAYFAALEGRDAFLICRGRTDLNPTVERIRGVPRALARRWRGRRLQEIPRTKLRGGADLLVSWPRGNAKIYLRLVIRYFKPKDQHNLAVKKRRLAKKNAWLYLLTNLPMEDFDADTVVDLYRLRWQVELAFKDWKSYANLHALQSEQPAIVEGFIWSSLCAAFLKRALAHSAQQIFARAVSTRIAAQAGPQLLPALADWAEQRASWESVVEALQFLAENALRTHPERDKRRPHQALGLRFVGVSVA